jgi:hypothetical protein
MYFLLMLWACLRVSFADGDQIFGELCSIDQHCINHLICEQGRCTTPYPPRAKNCAQVGFVYKDKKGKQVHSPWDLDKEKRLIQCPPFCGYKNSLIYGPICVLNERGCARSQECQRYGRCAFNGMECAPSVEGCATSEVCSEEGWCTYGENYCQLNETGCASSNRCKELGYCGLGEELTSGNPLLGKNRDEYDTRCVATPKGCAFSKRCLTKGICGFQPARIAKCEGSDLKCSYPATCVEGPPSPESYRNE